MPTCVLHLTVTVLALAALVDYYNHFSLLASIENLFGLKRLGYGSDLTLPVFDQSTFNAGAP